MTAEVCGDNRFELIEKYKKRLIESTNIGNWVEMKVIDTMLFKFWQMGWLDDLEKQIPKKKETFHGDLMDYDMCPSCNYSIVFHGNYCPICGQALMWEEDK